MDLDRMLERCREHQWQIGDLDWDLRPPTLSRAQEEAVVQYFTDMASIELLAMAMFEEQRRRSTDPRLRKIFSTFVVDERRHSEVALRLAAHYDVHQYRDYKESPGLTAFRPHFLSALRYMSAEIANAYITAGELLLDVALLRSLDDYVNDEMSHRAMRLVNRDESRHIAIDYHMVAHYASPEYRSWLAQQRANSLEHNLRAGWAMVQLMRTGGPFFMEVFWSPMQVADPDGKRLREAIKRIQLIQDMPGVSEHPMSRLGLALRDVFNHPVLGPLFGGLVQSVVGVPGELIGTLYTEQERSQAHRSGFEWLAKEALSAKSLH